METVPLETFFQRLRDLGVREVTIEHHFEEPSSPTSIACRFHFMSGTFADKGDWEMHVIEADGPAPSSAVRPSTDDEAPAETRPIGSVVG
jgi:hypothetical protein